MANETIQKLFKEIQAALERNTGVNVHSSNIQINERGRELVLEGVVDDISSKRIAANLARHVVGEKYEIDDQLRIATTEISDGALRDKVTQALLNEPVFRECNIVVHSREKTEHLRTVDNPEQGEIDITVADGVVTLSGHVISLSHKRIAEVLLWWVDGCQRVDNLLEITPPELDTDAELTDAVRMVLEKDPFVDASQVKVTIKGGVVELDGLLSSEEQRATALRDVWSIPDVWDVLNNINVAVK